MRNFAEVNDRAVKECPKCGHTAFEAFAVCPICQVAVGSAVAFNERLSHAHPPLTMEAMTTRSVTPKSWIGARLRLSHALAAVTLVAAIGIVAQLVGPPRIDLYDPGSIDAVRAALAPSRRPAFDAALMMIGSYQATGSAMAEGGPTEMTGQQVASLMNRWKERRLAKQRLVSRLDGMTAEQVIDVAKESLFDNLNRLEREKAAFKEAEKVLAFFTVTDQAVIRDEAEVTGQMALRLTGKNQTAEEVRAVLFRIEGSDVHLASDVFVPLDRPAGPGQPFTGVARLTGELVASLQSAQETVAGLRITPLALFGTALDEPLLFVDLTERRHYQRERTLIESEIEKLL